MNSWVYIFSRFTSEALLFEASILFLVMGFFAGLWLLRKRRIDESDVLIPAGLVKNYLSGIIGDAQRIQTELLGESGGPNLGSSAQFHAQAPLSAASVPTAGGVNIDATLAARLNDLEGKLVSQSKELDTTKIEKHSLEEEIKKLREQIAAGGSATVSGGNAAAAAQNEDLKKQLETLQARLEEYSVIEDDLANLKRLQQENQQLKAQLAGGGAPTGATAAAAPQPVAPAPTPQAAAPAPTPTPAAPIAEPAITPQAAAPTPTAPVIDTKVGTDLPAFENLVDTVEKSLQPSTPAPAAEPAITPQAAAPAPAQAATAQPVAPAEPAKASTAPINTGTNKSDADLLAEFEKMLSGG